MANWKKPWERNKTAGQKFGQPKLKKQGKELDVFDWIQEGREDTEIYETLEKYGMQDGWKRLKDENKQEVYADITNIGDLRNNLDKIRKGEEIWKNLPLEIRNEFQNNRELFIENGIKWAETKIQEIKEKKSKEIGNKQVKEQVKEQESDQTTQKENTNA